jgi:hypothetical protein
MGRICELHRADLAMRDVRGEPTRTVSERGEDT